MALSIRADSLFDGETLLRDGPYLIEINDSGEIVGVTDGAGRAAAADITAAFVTPGMVEAHAHVFLDGAELDNDKRNAQLGADFATMMETARGNVAKSARAGVTLIRDAGDRFGVNHSMRDELAASPRSAVRMRSPGPALKRPKRYGGFMARDIVEAKEIAPAVAELARSGDDIKIILTGIIDFGSGGVKGAPQFNAEELGAIVAAAHGQGRRTFAHCSGLAGLEVAAAAGVDSIEHGFFMTRDILGVMADKGMAWVPTFGPVHFQWQRPEGAGWDQTAIDHLRRILDSHLEHVALAHRMGVKLVAGSDAGSPGVDHGQGLIGEVLHFTAAGIPLTDALRAATSRPRALWRMPSANIMPGTTAELAIYDRSPFDDVAALRRARWIIRGDSAIEIGL